MILIDTSAWVEFFRRLGNETVKQRVATILETDEAAYTCPVLFELLVGARGQGEVNLVRDTFSLCERIPFRPDLWDVAGDLAQNLRRRGVSVPRDDILVATVASDAGIPVLCRDVHFDLIRQKALPSLRVEQA